MQISGINGISISTLAAIINAVNSQSYSNKMAVDKKPPATWRSPEEYAALRATWKCTRCTQKGHWYNICPDFT